MSEWKPTLRERFAALSTGKKVGAGLAALLVAGGGVAAVALSGGKGERHHRPLGDRPPGGPPPGGPAGPGGPDMAAGPPSDDPSRVVVLHDPVHHGRHGRHHPLGALLVPPPFPHRPAHLPEADLAVRRDIARLLEDVSRARAGEPPLHGAEPPLAGALLTAALTVAGLALAGAGAIVVAKVSAQTGFELGAYVAEALMARGVVAQMPHVPKVSAIGPGMTEKDGAAAFQALVQAVDGPLDSSGLSALRGLKDQSGITFWAAPGTDAKIIAEVAAIKAKKAAAAGKVGEV